MAHNPVLSPERERHLIQLIQAGDRGALGELLGAHRKRVYHVCLRMVSNADDAAELTQEALLRAIRHIDSFNATSRFGTWLMRIAMNLSISHLRRRKVRTAVSLDADRSAGPDQAAALKQIVRDEREPAAEASVELQEQLDQLQAALATLDPSLRSVILLRDLQEMDYRTIAEALAVPIGTVKSRLFRARLALRKAMEQAAAGDPELSDG